MFWIAAFLAFAFYTAVMWVYGWATEAKDSEQAADWQRWLDTHQEVKHE